MNNGVSKKLCLVALTEYQLYQLAMQAENPVWFAVMMTVLAVTYADIGDYIILENNGEMHSCKADIFAKTYELIADDDPDTHAKVMQEFSEKNKPDARFR